MTASKFVPGSPFMRWASTIAVGLAPLGCVLDLSSRAFGYSPLRWGGVMIGVSLVAIIYILRLQPRPLVGTDDQPLDEREQAQNLNTYVRAFWLQGSIAALIFAYMPFAVSHGWWKPSTETDWLDLSLTYLCLTFGLPSAVAHWQTPAPLFEEDNQ